MAALAAVEVAAGVTARLLRLVAPAAPQVAVVAVVAAGRTLPLAALGASVAWVPATS